MNISKDNLPDYVKVEQNYLTNYILKYNINRIASSAAYSPSLKSINKDKNNPSYGTYNEMSFA